MQANTDTSKPRVLYVDDEKNNLLSFKASFRMDFDVILANSPDEALSMLETIDVHVIISDFKMPFTNGIEMFEQIRKRFPNPMRILMTAYGDIQSLTDAINRGHVYKYIKKPWAEEDIRLSVKEAYEFFLTKYSLEQRNQELIEAYKDLDRFVYSVSHDLRSPLMGILALTNLMNPKTPEADLNNYIGLIKKNISRLDEFVVNLLEYYRVKRGELALQSLDVEALIIRLVDMYIAEADSKNTVINVDIVQTEDFISDPMLLMIALQNILSNALKYQKLDSEPGTNMITIKGKVENAMAILEIEDNGIGIDEEYLPKIFEMFFRASSQATGSGVGLYNTKHALDKLGAKVEVSSVLHVGTVFRLIIPSK